MIKKSSFTLIEILISIVLLSIIIIFLYQTLDISQKSNKFFAKKVDQKIKITTLKKILFKDILLSTKEKVKNNITIDKQENNILQLYTSNTYHNAFYNYITYMVSKKNNLLRIESKVKFDKYKLIDDFFDVAYVDTLIKNVKKFKVINRNKNQYAIYLKVKDESFMLVNYKSIR